MRSLLNSLSRKQKLVVKLSLIIGIGAITSFIIYSGYIAQNKTNLASKASEMQGFTTPQDANELKNLGLIDATNPPADSGLQAVSGDGSTDDTVKLQAIIDYAFKGTANTVNEFNQVTPGENEGRLAVILPGDDNDTSTPFKGDYLISDTLVLFQNSVHVERNGRLARAHILIGSTRTGKRPIIRLKPNAPKFQTPQNNAPLGQSKDVRPVIMISANAGTTDKGECDPFCNYQKPGDNFNQKIRNIHIIVETGNPTAVGLNFTGAQHSAIEDLKIELKS